MSELAVLVVDDEPEVCRFMERFLVSEGHQTRTIDDPTAAIDALKETVYNVVILDLAMPGCSGIDLLKKIREADPDIAAMIITGNPSVESAAESIQHGVSAYLRKPFSVDELRESLLRIMRAKGLAPRTELDLQRTIGENLRRARKARGLTLMQVAQRSQLSIGLLSKMERAESGMSLSSLFKVAAALEVKLRDLVDDF